MTALQLMHATDISFSTVAIDTCMCILACITLILRVMATPNSVRMAIQFGVGSLKMGVA